jgi:(heptosyl)LPS beta-1,4-glucosyltransferase
VPKLTVTVITRDEETNIEACLASVAWADEIVVVDSGSTDETVAIARRHSARVEVRPWPGYSAQKNYAASTASHDWILSIDADERVPPALAAEIQTLLASGPARRGYRVPRVTWYLGRWIRGTDWYPDYQLRLYDRRAGQWNGRRVHESVTLDDEPGRLHHDLHHLAYRDISDHLSTIDRYTTLAAEQWAEEGRRASLAGIILQPPFAFLRNYVLKRGFTQGAAGLLVSVLNSYYVFLKMAKAWELTRGARREARGAEDRGAMRDVRGAVDSRNRMREEQGAAGVQDAAQALGPPPSDGTSRLADRGSDADRASHTGSRTSDRASHIAPRTSD